MMTSWLVESDVHGVLEWAHDTQIDLEQDR